ncbi:MAG TPA: ribose 5-phosphate isomerase B [Desulfobacteria bacterium]|nr:ribose 5-phosphate isomerase B [Desulfobacteria bacterium]
MKIALGSDHGGFRLKNEIKQVFSSRGLTFTDLGTFSTDSVDYPDFALAVAEEVASGRCSLGIICCGTGIGVSIVANKVPGVRAAVCHDPYSARMAREHNDANVLTLGERVTGVGLAMDIVEAFLSAAFAGGRHAARVEKIRQIETKYCQGDRK